MFAVSSNTLHNFLKILIEFKKETQNDMQWKRNFFLHRHQSQQNKGRILLGFAKRFIM